MIRLSEPTLLGNELQYLEECIHSGWVSAEGGFVRKLEEELASYHGRGMLATATSSGTAALQLALLTMGLRPGELVLVPALSFLATINPVIHMGGEPLVLDVEPDCLGLSPEALLDYIRRDTIQRGGAVFDRTTGRRVFGVIAVHVYGIPCRIEELRRITQDYGLVLIEDNAEALGASVGSTPTGGFGDAAILSFNGNKAITGGGGGMLLSRQTGVVTDAACWANHCRPSSASEPEDYGFNLRMSNLQAAVALAQFEQRERIFATRRQHHAHYRLKLEQYGLRLLEGIAEDNASYWLHAVFFDQLVNLDALRNELERRGVQSRRMFRPFHRTQIYARFSRWECPIADRAYQSVLAMPSSSHLKLKDLDAVCDALSAALDTAEVQKVSA